MVQAIWKQDERKYTALNDLMRTFLMNDNTPNVEQQLSVQFNVYFAWHEDQVERGNLASFGERSGSQHNRDVLVGKLAFDAPRLVSGPSDWIHQDRLATLIIKLKDIACN